MRTKNYIALFAATVLALSGCKEKEVNFTYSPDTPRAGQTISFTNNTAEGETWEWTFGDGTSASSKNPTKIYKKAGQYTVTLKVDKKNHRTYSQTVQVVDTTPRIILAEDSVIYYMQPTLLRMSAYNPYNYDRTYEWLLDDEVELIEGDPTDEVIKVIFKQHDLPVKVECLFTQGEAHYALSEAFFVEDTTAQALYMAETSGQIYCQRTFKYGTELPMRCEAKVDDHNLPTEAILHQLTATNGLEHQSWLFWTSNDSVFRRPVTSSHWPAAYWTSVTHLGYGLTAGQTITGLAWYNDVCMLAYGNGIYRFRETDIDAGATPEAGAILTDVAVKRFAVDAVGQKIYYLTDAGLHVCNISGASARLLTNKADGRALAVDNGMNRLYWSQADGVWYMPLVQSANNATEAVPLQLNNVQNVQVMVCDLTPRKCRSMHY